MEEQRYWRNLIGREIKAEHDRVKKYYSQRSANAGGISSEEQTRLNIFLLCQSIAEKYNADIQPVNQEDKPKKPRVKKDPVPLAETKSEPTIQKTGEEEIQELNSFIEETATVQDSDPTTQNEGSTLQNEFGELV